VSNKKQQKLSQATTNNLRNPTEPFQDYDASVFAAMAEADIQTSTLPIMGIIPDETQPRRVLPHGIRRAWDGTPQGYGTLIDTWESYAHKGIKWSHPVDILIGKASLPDLKTDDPLVLDFAELLGFAANIRDIGLNHPIGVVKRGNYHRIVFGERRWTGFQILNHYLGDNEDWSTIPVKIATAGDWELAKAQAAENNQSKRLSAIGRAREFAKLLMIARTDGGERYDSWDQLVVSGGCDRAWYAQVSNGELHRIPRNLGPQFEQSLNISETTMRKYRSLLRLFDDHKLSNKVNDAIWILGDTGKWSENFMRDIRHYLSVEEVDEILNLNNGYTVPVGTVYTIESALFRAVKAAKEAEEIAKKAAELAQKQAEEAAALAAAQNTTSATTEAIPADTVNADSAPATPDQSGWASSAWVKKLAYSGPVKVLVKTAETESTVIVETESGEEFEVNVKSLREYTESDSKPLPNNLTAKAVQTVAGLVALVQTDANGYVRLRFPDDTTAQMEKKFVSLVDMSEWYAAVRQHNAAKAAAQNTGPNGAATPTTPVATATPKTGSTTAIEAEAAESDDSTPEPEVLDFTPFDGSNLEILNALTVIAEVLDIQEAEILGDLCNLDRTRLERVLAIEGMAEVHKWEDIYRSAANTVIFATMQRVEAHLISIAEFARKTTETE
jgi:hypothetical protein